MNGNPLSPRAGALRLLGAGFLLVGVCGAQTSQTPSGFRVRASMPVGAAYSSTVSGQSLSSRVQTSPGATRSPNLRIRLGLAHPELSALMAFRCALEAGWNLRAFPFSTQETVGELFVGSAGYPIKIGDLYAWSKDSYESIGDNEQLAHSRGFWVYSYWGGMTRQARAEAPAPRELLLDQLGPGWNLYGPSEYLSLPASALIGSAWQWDSGNQVYRKLDAAALLLPGEAYWIFRESPQLRRAGAASAPLR